MLVCRPGSLPGLFVVLALFACVRVGFAAELDALKADYDAKKAEYDKVAGAVLDEVDKAIDAATDPRFKTELRLVRLCL